jgi:hypothetical protein
MVKRRITVISSSKNYNEFQDKAFKGCGMYGMDF